MREGCTRPDFMESHDGANVDVYLHECLNPAIAPDADWPELSRDYWPASGAQSGIYNTAVDAGLCQIASSHFMQLKKTRSKQNATFVMIMKKSLYFFNYFY